MQFCLQLKEHLLFLTVSGISSTGLCWAHPKECAAHHSPEDQTPPPQALPRALLWVLTITSTSSSHKTTASLAHSVPTGRNSRHAVNFATSDFVLLLAADPRHHVKRMQTPGSWNPPPWGRSAVSALLSTKQQGPTHTWGTLSCSH